MAGNQTRDAVGIKIIPREQAHRNRERHRRYNAKRPKKHRIPNSERPFVMWDGEGPQDAGYALFGNSLGYEICHPYLSTEECLDLMLECQKENPAAIHIAFGFNYDASMILRQLPWRCLNALKVYGSTYWHDYEIEHIPHKWFKVRKDGITAQIFDIRNFFPGSYLGALRSLQVGSESDLAHIGSGKAQRATFIYAEIREIAAYFRVELKLGPLLAEKLRAAFLGAGFDLKSWHGPGALARMALDKHNVADAMCETPFDVREAARYAFAGGRFEMFRGGHCKGTVYNADLRSAYPGFARYLPNLARGKWRYGKHYEPGKFALYHIVYNSPNTNPLHIHPLFRREKGGTVCWPSRTEGWYHSPEAELVKDDNSAEFVEAWIFDEEDETDRPFAWIQEYFDKRMRLKRMGNHLELTFKLIINSIYGQLAQRSGWDRRKNRPPRTHQIEWAGYITSACRAAVYRAACALGDKLISIDTDGIYAMAPVSVVPGSRLGEWELNEYEAGIFWQSGIYCLQLDGKWEKGRTRGIPKGAYQPGELLDAMDKDEALHLTIHTFIGYGLAINGQFDKWNQWFDEPREIVFGGQGKRYHNVPFYCKKGACPGNGMHNFIPPPEAFRRASFRSEPHYLPWLNNHPDMARSKLLVGDFLAFNENHTEEDEIWERADYAYA